MSFVPRAMLPLKDHKCLGVRIAFEVNCECGWHSCPHSDREQAYSEWRGHIRSKGGETESFESWEKRENRYRKKIGLEPWGGY